MGSRSTAMAFYDAQNFLHPNASLIKKSYSSWDTCPHNISQRQHIIQVFACGRPISEEIMHVAPGQLNSPITYTTSTGNTLEAPSAVPSIGARGGGGCPPPLGRSPGNDDEVSIICFPHKLNIVLERWQGLRTPDAKVLYTVAKKKNFILQSKGGHFFFKFATALCTAKLLPIFF